MQKSWNREAAAKAKLEFILRKILVVEGNNRAALIKPRQL
jgi:hypothetical protein